MTAEREALLYATGYADGQRHMIELLQSRQHELSTRVDALQERAAHARDERRRRLVFDMSDAGAAKQHRISRGRAR